MGGPLAIKKRSFRTSRHNRRKSVDETQGMYEKVGACLFVWGFHLPNRPLVVREVGLCNVDGTNHACYHYKMPEEFTDDAQVELLRQQTRFDHGLDHLPDNRYREYQQLGDDIASWLERHLTPERSEVALHPTGLIPPDILPNVPTVIMSDRPCLRTLPIGSIGAFPSGQYELLCREHGRGDVWHDICARLMACRMSAWIRSVNPHHVHSLDNLNRQRIIWQKRADALMNTILCNGCREEKDEAYAGGNGIAWVPNCDHPCKQVARILEENVYEKDTDYYTGHMTYGDADLKSLWVFSI